MAERGGAGRSNRRPRRGGLGRLALADVPARDVRRGLLTGALFLVVLGLFLWMVHEMLVAGLLGGNVWLQLAGIAAPVLLLALLDRYLRRR